MPKKKEIEEYRGYTIKPKQIGFYFGVCVYTEKGRLIYETPAEFHLATSAVHHGLRWLKSIWLKEE